MKRFFLFILILTAFVSCGGDVCGGCKNWETCNTETSKCELKSGKCEDSTNCDWGYMCNAEHNCIDENNPCEGVFCDEWKSCNNDNGVCELTEGRCLKNDDCTENKICNESHYCVVKSCTDNETTEIACGLNDNGLQTQKCVNKVWINEGVCVDSDVCKNGQKKAGTISCDLNGTFYQQICENGKWVDTNNCINPTYFITTWKTDNEGISLPTQIRIPISSFDYNYKIDCNNDGVFEAENVTTSYTCNYDVAGIYQVAITGTFPAIQFGFENYDFSDKNKLISVDQWGNNKWVTMNDAFYYCEYMTITATDKPDLSNVQNMSNMFNGAKSFNQPIGHWDVSNVKYMDEMFYEATSFNQDLSSWNVLNAESMSLMFKDAKSFNQPIGNWDVSNVEYMGGMFFGATSFNQDLSSWDVSNVTNMPSMFSHAISFNQDISSWDVSNVTNMQNMFTNAILFNQNISSWDVSNVTNMQSMFHNAKSFNQDLSSWDVSKVIYCVGYDEGADNWILPQLNFTQCIPE